MDLETLGMLITLSEHVLASCQINLKVEGYNPNMSRLFIKAS